LQLEVLALRHEPISQRREDIDQYSDDDHGAQQAPTPQAEAGRWAVLNVLHL